MFRYALLTCVVIRQVENWRGEHNDSQLIGQGWKENVDQIRRSSRKERAHCDDDIAWIFKRLLAEQLNERVPSRVLASRGEEVQDHRSKSPVRLRRRLAVKLTEVRQKLAVHFSGYWLVPEQRDTRSK